MKLCNMKFRLNRRGLFLWILVFLFVLDSGSAIGSVFAPVMIPLFFLVSAIGYMIYPRKRINTNDRVTFTLFLLAFHLFSLLIYSEDGVDVNAYVAYMIRILACYCFCGGIDVDEFECKFTKIIYSLGIMSLICYIISQTQGIISSAVQIKDYVLLGIHNYTGYEIGRNSGIFWEPGAYQLFLNLAIFFHAKSKNLNLKSLIDFTGIVLVISVLTTKSTTGYFTLAVICAYLVYMNWNSLSWRQRILSFIPMIILLTVGTSLLLSSDAVFNKFYGKGNSFAIRLNDFMESGGAIIQHPFIGYGLGTTTFITMASSKGLEANSVGLFCAAIYFGVIYCLIYTYRIFKKIYILQKNYFIIASVILFFSMMTEDFYRSALYFVFAIGVQQHEGKRNDDNQANN